MKNLNKMKIAPDMQYEIGQDKIGYFPEWSVKDDETLWQKVNKLAHSTFDRSKFTLVGSPSLTDDGIYTSNLAFGNFTNGFTLPVKWGDLKGKSWNIKFRAYGDGTNNSTNPFGYQIYNSDNKFRVAWQRLYWYFTVGDSLDYRSNVYTERAFPSTAGMYDAILSFNINTKTYSYKLVNVETGEVYNSSTYTATETTSPELYQINESPDNYITWRSFAPNTRMDFKYFSITVDGVPVFSGNKTGIDTIKPDDYTVVGSPTISDDGVASGFSSGNYIKTPTINFQSFNSWSIVQKFTFNNTNIFCLIGDVTDQYGIRLSYIKTDNTWAWFLGNGTWFTLTYGSIPNPFVSGNDYYIKSSFDGTNYTLSYSTDGYSYTNMALPYSNSNKISNTPICIGSRIGNNGISSIDLNALKIYVDGNLVYQPCLKIPYTEGQNYVKIVDKLYRDRVKDLFEQKGYNGYYTIGEDDFTFPSNKWSDVIEHKENGLTVAEQRVDQTLTIRGACEQGVDVNLPMEFFSADSYAVFGVGTTGTNTASKFTPAADGNYIAIGKGKV